MAAYSIKLLLGALLASPFVSAAALPQSGRSIQARQDSSAPAEEPPAEKTPAEKTPAEQTPAEKTPAEKTPAEKTPAEMAEDMAALPADKPDKSGNSTEVAEGYINLAYYGNWRAYSGHYVQNLPIDDLTHIVYSFADIKKDGTVFIADEYVDLQMQYPNDKAPEKGKEVLYGNLKQLYLLKKKNRNLRTSISVAGATYSPHIVEPASSEKGRKKIASTIVDMVKDFGLDGIDVDWEFPNDKKEAGDYLELLKEIRKQLDEYADALATHADKPADAAERPHFDLMIATHPAETIYGKLPLGDIGKVVDYVNLMAYDLSGPWDETGGHQANLFPSTECEKCTPWNIHKAVTDYTTAGVPPERLVLGLPLYGRAFNETKGPGQKFTKDNETLPVDYFRFPLDGFDTYYDSTAAATWAYNSKDQTFITYDTHDLALIKTAWALNEEQPTDLDMQVDAKVWDQYKLEAPLAGIMYWDTYSDLPAGKGGIMEAVGQTGLKGKYRKSENWLFYPDSKYENVKENMGEEKSENYDGSMHKDKEEDKGADAEKDGEAGKDKPAEDTKSEDAAATKTPTEEKPSETSTAEKPTETSTEEKPSSTETKPAETSTEDKPAQ